MDYDECRNAWRTELARQGIDTVQHCAILDAIWREMEAHAVSGVSYLESLLASSEIEEAVDELVGTARDHPLFRYAELEEIGVTFREALNSNDNRGGRKSDEGTSEDEDLGEVGASASQAYVARINAFSEYVSKVVAVDDHVMSFRQRVFGGPLQIISRVEAHKLVRSPAAQVFSIEDFAKQHIPPTNHEAVLEDVSTIRKDGRKVRQATVFVDPPGTYISKDLLNPSEDDILTFEWPWEEAGPPYHAKVWRGSLLGELKGLGARLARKHPWTEDQGALFILTGALIAVPALTAGIHKKRMAGGGAHRYNYDLITMKISPWMPAELVRKAYLNVRRHHASAVRQRTEERNVEVFYFVLRQSEASVLGQDKLRKRPLGKLVLPRWKELRRRWNEVYPSEHKWHYGQDDPHAKIFRRDFSQGQETVIGTRYGLPGIPRQPMFISEAEAEHERWVKRLAAEMDANKSWA